LNENALDALPPKPTSTAESDRGVTQLSLVQLSNIELVVSLTTVSIKINRLH